MALQPTGFANRLTIASATVFFRRALASGGYTEAQQLSPSSVFDVEQASESLDYVSREDASRGQLASVATSLTRTGTLELQNGSVESLALALGGTVSPETQAGATVSAEISAPIVRGVHTIMLGGQSAPVYTISAVTVGVNASTAWVATTAYTVGVIRVPTSTPTRWYIVTVAGTTGASEPTWPTTIGATVVDGTVTWTCMGTIAQTVATDYELDTARGLIHIVPGGQLAQAQALLPGGASFTLDTDYTRAAVTYQRVITGSSITVAGQIIALGEDQDGRKGSWVMKSVQLRPTGTLSFKSEEFRTLAFEVAILTPSGGVAIEYHELPA